MIDRETIENLKRRVRYELQRKSPPPGFPRLPDIPAGRHISEEFYQLELRHLWSNTRLHAGLY